MKSWLHMYKTMNYEDIEHIVVHAADTPATMDIGAADIDRWHREKGWWRIGYHFVIRRDGTLEVGRPLHNAGAHAKGFNNCSWGICMAGGRAEDGGPENNFTPAQFETLRSTVAFLKVLAPQADVDGHRDLPEVTKDCPCFDVHDWYGANFQ